MDTNGKTTFKGKNKLTILVISPFLIEPLRP